MSNEEPENYIRLRREYDIILPQLKKIESFLVTTVAFQLKSIIFDLHEHERIDIKSRIKTFESSISKLGYTKRGRNHEGSRKSGFPIKDDKISLSDITDLVGLRILVFPSHKISIMSNLLVGLYPWASDENFLYGLQYQGKIEENENIGCEIQIVPMLLGHYLEIEHFVLYKPCPLYKRINEDCSEIRQLHKEICDKLTDFEQKFSGFLKEQRGF